MSACTRIRSSRSSTYRAILDQEVAVALARDRRPAVVAPAGSIVARTGSSADGREGPRAAERGGARLRTNASCIAAPPAPAAAASTVTKPHAVAGRELADLPQIGLDHHQRANEAAQAGAVGPEDDRHVAGEVDARRWRRRCRGCSRGAGRPHRRRVAPSAASARSDARRCGWSCSAPSSPSRRTSSMSSGVKKSGAPCGP